MEFLCGPCDGFALSAWRSGSFPAPALRHWGLQRLATGAVGVVRCAKARGLFELAYDDDRFRTALALLNVERYDLRIGAAMDCRVKFYMVFYAVITLPVVPIPSISRVSPWALGCAGSLFLLVGCAVHQWHSRYQRRFWRFD